MSEILWPGGSGFGCRHCEVLVQKLRLEPAESPHISSIYQRIGVIAKSGHGIFEICRSFQQVRVLVLIQRVHSGLIRLQMQ